MRDFLDAVFTVGDAARYAEEQDCHRFFSWLADGVEKRSDMIFPLLNKYKFEMVNLYPDSRIAVFHRGCLEIILQERMDDSGLCIAKLAVVP